MAQARKLQANDSAPMFAWAWRVYGEYHDLLLPEPTPEYEFNLPASRHRFDWAFPGYFVAVEVDGGRFAQHGGRHSSPEDILKRNIATSNGWWVFNIQPDRLHKDPFSFCTLVWNRIQAVKRAD